MVNSADPDAMTYGVDGLRVTLIDRTHFGASVAALVGIARNI
jgi:hypothetical protein